MFVSGIASGMVACVVPVLGAAESKGIGCLILQCLRETTVCNGCKTDIHHDCMAVCFWAMSLDMQHSVHAN
jgi:hypothetical protein